MGRTRVLPGPRDEVIFFVGSVLVGDAEFHTGNYSSESAWEVNEGAAFGVADANGVRVLDVARSPLF